MDEPKKRTHDEKIEEPQPTIEPKNKKKKKNGQSIKPTISYDLVDLFSPGGKRAQGTHLHMVDMRTLLMLTVHGERFPVLPNWCQVYNWRRIKKTVVVLVGAVSLDDFKQHKQCFNNIVRHFGEKSELPVRNEGGNCFVISPLQSLLFYKMPKKLEAEVNRQKKEEQENGKATSFHELLLTPAEYENNFFPAWNTSAEAHGVVTTRKEPNKRVEAHKDSSIFALDCEMCKCGDEMALTRVTLVDGNAHILYDQLIKPKEPITDYVTQYSGITEEKLRDVSTRLEDAQKGLLEIIQPDSIIIGHSLDFDLRALKMHHDHVIDTSLLYPDIRGPRFRHSLKKLAKTYLGREIQNAKNGHCSIEDATTCMKLVQLKLKKGKSFGDVVSDKESIFTALNRVDKKGSLLEDSVILRQHPHCLQVPCRTDEEVVEQANNAIEQSDFTFCHLKEYKKYLKGRSSDSDDDRKEEEQILIKVDKNVGTILDHVPAGCLVMVYFGSAHVEPDIIEAAKDKKERKSEKIKAAMLRAKNGLAFIKIT